MVQTIDLILRFAAISQFIVVAAVLLKAHRDKPAGILSSAWALSVACYLLAAPIYRDWQWGPWGLPVLAGAMAGSVLMWLAARALFEDDFTLRPWHLALLAGVVVIGTASFVPPDAALADSALVLIRESLPPLMSVVFAVLAIAVVLRDWRIDLVESRRRFRLILLSVAGSYSLIIAAVTLLLAGGVRDLPYIDLTFIDMCNAAVLFTIALAINIGLLDLHPGFLLPRESRKPPADTPADHDPQLSAALQTLMQKDRLYREHGLTIGSLAQRLGEKEYRLRRLINGQFGYRNFNEFLNGYRLDEIAARLVDADSQRLPVLTLALDAGFQSLGPFNRAFKSAYGMTPTEYRKHHTTSA